MSAQHLSWEADLDIGAFYSPSGELHFIVDFEPYDEEPYSWGGSRGSGLDVTAKFDCFVLGLKMIRRADLIDLIGSAEVAGLEQRASEWFAERADQFIDAA